MCNQSNTCIVFSGGTTALPTPSVPRPGECPENWVQNGSICYDFQPGFRLTWEEGEQHCQVRQFITMIY